MNLRKEFELIEGQRGWAHIVVPLKKHEERIGL
jgi:hypothetical protein